MLIFHFCFTNPPFLELAQGRPGLYSTHLGIGVNFYRLDALLLTTQQRQSIEKQQ